jgi:hypothetical protein
VTRPAARRFAATALGAVIATAGTAALPVAASANSSQLAMIQDNSDLVNTASAFAQFRELGANTVRVIIPWSQIAPDSSAKKKPVFNATDPNAYPASGWAPYDNLVRKASQYGLRLDFTVTGGAPVWADGPGVPKGGTNAFFAWKPNATEYGQFVQAVGERYDGHFTPTGETSPLPAVHFWALYNEANFGEDLGPQAIKRSTVSIAPMMYRNLIANGWRALQRTGHGHDTILIGEFAARGMQGPPSRQAPQGYPGNYGQTKPLTFIRTLYCVDNNYHAFRGSYARARGCPTNAAGSRRFRSQNPGLFKASGVSDHPYALYLSPIADGRNDPNFASFPDLGSLARTMDRVLHVYGSHKHYPIYNTEYGYITHPPKAPPYVSPTKASLFLNWAEYLSYKNPRVKSYMQYLLEDPPPTAGPYSGFASGLETYKGTKKATFYAYRMPFYMPETRFKRSQKVEVWGDVRPAPFAMLDGFGPQRAQIQLKSGGGSFRTIKTVALNRPGGYFDVRMKFPSSGTVRIQWTYPSGDSLLSDPNVDGQTIDSRTITVKAR